MAEPTQLIVYAAAYKTRWAALADLDALDQQRGDEVTGHYDAAVLTHEDGRPHVVKRLDHPWTRIIPEAFGGGVLPREELHEAAEELTRSEAGIILVGEPTIEAVVDGAFPRASTSVKRLVRAPSTAQITRELQEALGGGGE
jgi:hypothetical protein